MSRPYPPHLAPQAFLAVDDIGARDHAAVWRAGGAYVFEAPIRAADDSGADIV
jgi:hypothetical protein